MSQYRLIAYKDGVEVARMVGGDAVAGLLDGFTSTAADIVELWEKADGSARFQRVGVKSELDPLLETAHRLEGTEADRVARIAIRHFPVPADTDEFRAALAVVFAAGAVFGKGQAEK